jgi:hypothetical protein
MRLFNLIAGWQRRYFSEGVVLLPPGGYATGAIIIRERVTPLRSVKAAIAHRLAALTPAVAGSARIQHAERFVTVEGEYATTAWVSSTSGAGEPLELQFGFVFGDRTYAEVYAVVSRTDRTEHFRELVTLLTRSYYLGLGSTRSRRYLYTPPAGWRGWSGAHATHWYHPQYPKVHGIVHVFDTKPAVIDMPTSVDRLLFLDYLNTLELDPPEPGKTVSPPNGLVGTLLRHTGIDPAGNRRCAYQATLLDQRFHYTSQLEASKEHDDELLLLFLRLLESIKPLPQPEAGAQHTSAVIHWAD